MSELLRFAPSGCVPNSALPVLLYREGLPAGAGAAGHETLFARHGWTKAWRNGVYPVHHYHSTSHEVLGIYGGSASLRLGGEDGRDVAVQAGDVIVLPAGTGHRCISASADFGVVGAYPEGRDWDLIRADDASDEDVRRAKATIARVPVPDRDPVTGEPLNLWV